MQNKCFNINVNKDEWKIDTWGINKWLLLLRNYYYLKKTSITTLNMSKRKMKDKDLMLKMRIKEDNIFYKRRANFFFKAPKINIVKQIAKI